MTLTRSYELCILCYSRRFLFFSTGDSPVTLRETAGITQNLSLLSYGFTLKSYEQSAFIVKVYFAVEGEKHFSSGDVFPPSPATYILLLGLLTGLGGVCGASACGEVLFLTR